MLKLLLDEHVSPKVATGLRRRNPAIVSCICMTTWEDGNFLGQDDSACLKQAAMQGLTLVTYDRRTIPPLLKIWAETGQRHGGVIFVEDKSLSAADIGGLVRALLALVRQTGMWDWSDRVAFLRR